MERFRLPVEITPLPDGNYEASCPTIEGCHAEGRTIVEAMDHMEDIVRSAVNMSSPYAVLAHPHLNTPMSRRRCPII